MRQGRAIRFFKLANPAWARPAVCMLTARRTFVPPRNPPKLSISRTIRRSDDGAMVRLIQEWLCLRGHLVALDGSFGPATEQAVRDFQTAARSLPITGEVDPDTFAALVTPMIEALRLITIPEDSRPAFGDMVTTYAHQHLQQRAREVGGQNRGPWVRLYLHGHERPARKKLPFGEWAWCAGFVSTILEQTAATLNRRTPLSYRWNCTNLGREAARKKLLIRGEEARRHPDRIAPGSLMLVRKRRRNHWHHTGIVVQATAEFVRTIEGNSTFDHDDVPYGHEVALNTRAYGNLDFVNT
jgi:peptidoglycan hydrolase-like protein with peptidoglycan-binding domain